MNHRSFEYAWNDTAVMARDMLHLLHPDTVNLQRHAALTGTPLYQYNHESVMEMLKLQMPCEEFDQGFTSSRVRSLIKDSHLLV